MLFQIDLLVIRVILSVSVQIVGGIVGLILGLRILKRRKGNISVSVGIAFIMLSFGYIFLSFSSLVLIDPIPLVIYAISYNVVMFGYMFILIFTVNLCYANKEPFSNWQKTYVVTYAVVIAALLFIPNSITLDQSTNWITTYSWEFSLALMIFYSLSVFIPEIYFLIKVIRQITEKALRKRLQTFLFGALWFVFTPIPLFLYNTWVDNLVYRAVYGVISYFQLIPLALLYFGTKKL